VFRFMDINIRTNRCKYIYIHTYIHIDIHTYAVKKVYIMYVYTCGHIYVYLYAYVHIHIYLYVDIWYMSTFVYRYLIENCFSAVAIHTQKVFLNHKGTYRDILKYLNFYSNIRLFPNIPSICSNTCINMQQTISYYWIESQLFPSVL
jgi:hypothetical protein